MASVLETLEYSNLKRIWLKRVEQDVREGRRKVTKSVFELHIVRETESGATYEDTIDHLSESEREVTGLVFALAEYLAHEVYEIVPFMLLDSLEAIDADRIARLHHVTRCPKLLVNTAHCETMRTNRRPEMKMCFWELEDKAVYSHRQNDVKRPPRINYSDRTLCTLLATSKMTHGF